MPEGGTPRQLLAAVGAAVLLCGAQRLCALPWPSVLAGTVCAALYYYIYVYAARRAGGLSPQAAIRRSFGRAAGPALVLTALFFAVLSGLLAARSAAYFPELGRQAWVGLGVLALALGASHGKPVTVLRCGSVLLVPLAAAFTAVLLCSVHAVEPAYLTGTPDPSSTVQAALWLLLPMTGAYLTPMLRSGRTRLFPWMAAFGAFSVACAVIAAGCLSPELAAQPGAFYRLARSISVFGVMVRLEALICAAMTACAFLGCALLLGAARLALAPLGIPAEAKTATAALGLTAAAADLYGDRLPAGWLLPLTGIFCVGIPLLAQVVAVRKMPQKKCEKMKKMC